MPGTVEFRLAMLGSAEIKRQLDEIEQRLNTFGKQQPGGPSMELGSEEAIRAKAAFEQLSGAQAGAKNSVEDLSSAYTVLSGVLEGLALGAVVHTLEEWVMAGNSAVRTADAMALSLGTSVEGFQQLRFAAQASGEEAEVFEHALTRMMANLGEARLAFQRLSDSAEQSAISQKAMADAAQLSADRTADSVQTALNAVQHEAHALRDSEVAARKATDAYNTFKRAHQGQVFAGNDEKDIALRQRLNNLADASIDANNRISDSWDRLNQAQHQAFLAGEANRVAREKQEADMDKIARAGERGETAIMKFYDSVGLLKDSTTNDALEIFPRIVQGLKNVDDATARADYARRIFGRGWVGIARVLNQPVEKLRELFQVFKDADLAFTGPVQKMAEDFNISFGEMSARMEGLKNLFGVTLGQAFVPWFEALSDWEKRNKDTVLAVADSFVKDGMPLINVFVSAFASAFAVLGATITNFINFLHFVTSLFNDLFGKDTIGPNVLAWGVAIGIVIKLVIDLGARLPLIGTAIRTISALFAANPWAAALALVIVAVGELIINWDKWQGKIETSDGLFTKVAKSFVHGLDLIANSIDTVIGLFDLMIGKEEDAKAAGDRILKRLAAEASPSPNVQNNASGGYIRGPGSDTSDSILSRLSNGEFVVQAKAVRRAGLKMLNDINNLRLPSFAQGGLVGAAGMMSPRSVAPALSKSSTILNLTIDGQTFRGLQAPEHTANQLVRYARGKSLVSTAPMPEWYPT